MHERMERFWRWLAVVLGKRAGLVSVIGLLITVALGAGISRLEFTSSQDAYLNKTDQGQVRKALLPFFPDQRHALIITRLPGNESIEQEGRGADFTTATMQSLHCPHTTIVTGGAAVLLKDINEYLKGGMLFLGGIAF